MKRSTSVLAAALSVSILIGCAPEEAAEPDPEMAATDTSTHVIDLKGDFEGPLGLQLWSLRHYAADDPAGALATARKMGFREVETGDTYGMTPEAFRVMLDEAGLDATSMHADYTQFRDSLDVVLDKAEALGVQYVGIAWIPHPNDQPFTEAMGLEAARDFNTWGSAARERGLQFFYHVHGYEYRLSDSGTTPFDVMVAETDPATVQYEMDVFWVAHSGTDPAALLRKYPDRWGLMHLKDMKIGTPTPDHSGSATAEDDVPVGTGQIDYRAVLEAAKEIGLARYYLEDESTDPLGNVPRSVSFLETVQF